MAHDVLMISDAYYMYNDSYNYEDDLLPETMFAACALAAQRRELFLEHAKTASKVCPKPKKRAKKAEDR